MVKITITMQNQNKTKKHLPMQTKAMEYMSWFIATDPREWAYCAILCLYPEGNTGGPSVHE